MKITDEMVEAGLAQYSEGGCMGLDEGERREVVVAILEAAALAAQTQQGVEVKNPWRCDECGCHSFAKVHERKPDGSFGPGPDGRCVECKKVHHNVSALVDVPAVESEPVAFVSRATLSSLQNGFGGLYQMKTPKWKTEETTVPLYAHPPRSLSNEGWMPIETAPRDGTAVDLWGSGRRATDVSWGLIRDWMGKEREGWQHGMPDDFEPTHWMSLPTPPLSTRKGSAGDGAATGTKGCA